MKRERDTKQVKSARKNGLETLVDKINTSRDPAWHKSNADFPESTKFQDLVEYLKLNKEAKGLGKVCE